jgi:hypothetical protein
MEVGRDERARVDALVELDVDRDRSVDRERVRSRIDGHDLERARRGESGGSGLHHGAEPRGEREEGVSAAEHESFSAGGEVDVAVTC